MLDHFLQRRTHSHDRYRQHDQVSPARSLNRIASSHINHLALKSDIKIRLTTSKPHNPANNTRAPRNKRKRPPNKAHPANSHLSKQLRHLYDSRARNKISSFCPNKVLTGAKRRIFSFV
jgi:hypothetical protein